MTVKNVLLDKHPTAQPVDPSAILPDNRPPSFDPIIFESFTPELIRSTVLKINGSAGPSGLDAADWKRLCTSFGLSSDELCRAVAMFGKRICSSFVDPSGLYPFLASRLIAIDKLP